MLASVAVHVLVITSVFPQPGAEESANVTTGVGSHESVADAIPVFAGEVSSPHSKVTFAGQLITGAVVSIPAAMTTGLLLQASLHVASPVSSTVTLNELGAKLRNTLFPT